MAESIFFPIIDNGGGNSRTAWGMSLFQLGLSGILGGRSVQLKSISYPYPDGAMNIATNEFRESRCDRMVVIDTDEVFEPWHVDMLLSHDVPFVSGLYPKKCPGLNWPVVPLDSDPLPFADDGRSYPREVARCARGFLALRREVFDTMEPHVDRYFCEETQSTQFLFWKGLPGGHSEDFQFCDKWRELGGKILVDPRITVLHEGSCSYPIPGTY
jgi:hypothetical protein